jgi:hypothetical protein
MYLLISTSTASVSSAGAVAVLLLPPLKSREGSCLHWRGFSLEEDNSDVTARATLSPQRCHLSEKLF